MGQVIAISEGASIAIHAALLLAMHEGQPRTTRNIAESLAVSENHCSKIMQRLTRAGMVRATRGPQGGFLLVVDPKQTNLLEIYEIIDGLLQEKHCMFKINKCPASQCVFSGITDQLARQVRTFLQTHTIAEMAEAMAKGKK